MPSASDLRATKADPTKTNIIKNDIRHVFQLYIFIFNVHNIIFISFFTYKVYSLSKRGVMACYLDINLSTASSFEYGSENEDLDEDTEPYKHLIDTQVEINDVLKGKYRLIYTHRRHS